MLCATVGKANVLLAKQAGKIFALLNTCSHLGGPLAAGKLLSNACVQCPWHDSVFSLEDGAVVNGPATHKQPVFETRIYNGKIQVKLASTETVKRMDTEDQLA